MPNFHIEPTEYLSNCSTYDIKEIVQLLVEDGHLPKATLNHPQVSKICVSDEIFEDALYALHGNRFKLTTEEENLIIKIAQRFKY